MMSILHPAFSLHFFSVNHDVQSSEHILFFINNTINNNNFFFLNLNFFHFYCFLFYFCFMLQNQKLKHSINKTETL